jgi:hypothetical protein
VEVGEPLLVLVLDAGGGFIGLQGQGFQGAPPICYLEEVQVFATI